MPDKNFLSFSGRVGYVANLIIDPPTDTQDRWALYAGRKWGFAV